MSVTPSTPEQIGGQITADTLLALRLTGPGRGMMLANVIDDTEEVLEAVDEGDLQMMFATENQTTAFIVSTSLAGRVLTVDIGSTHWRARHNYFSWGDGSPQEITAEFVVIHTYTAPGRYRVNIRNDMGQSKTIMVNVA